MSVKDDLLAQLVTKISKAMEHYAEMCILAEIDILDAMASLSTVFASVAAIVMVPVPMDDKDVNTLGEIFKKKLVEANAERRKTERV